MEFFTGGIVVFLMGAGFDMSTQRSAIGVNIVVEQFSGAASTILIEGKIGRAHV